MNYKTGLIKLIKLIRYNSIFIFPRYLLDLKTYLNQLKVSQSLEVYGASLRVCMSVCTRVFTKGLRSLKISQQIIAHTKTKHTFYQIKKLEPY